MSSAGGALDTTASWVSESTLQRSSSLGSIPSTVATAMGTVVFSEGDSLDAGNTLDRNSRTVTAKGTKGDRGHKKDLSMGHRVGHILKRRHVYRSIHGPMKGWDEGFAPRERKAIRFFANNPNSVTPVGKIAFKVRSETKTRGWYEVVLDRGVWSCQCPDWEDRSLACKHIALVLHALDPNRTPVEAASLDNPENKGPARDWPAYDAAHRSEPLLFDELMWDLLEPLEGVEGDRPVGKPGRPATPLRVQLFIAAKYVRSRKGSRGANGELAKECKIPDSILKRAYNDTAPSRVFNRPGTTELLLELLERSALPLKDIEDGGTAAVDSTGFCVECRGSYCTERHDPSRRHKWVKAHLIIGCRTHVILSAKITDEHGGDAPQFLYLLSRVLARGHNPRKVAADRAYLSKKILEGSVAMGVDPLIPFKVNSVARAGGSRIWRQKYHEFMARREQFEREYHARSQVESVNGSIKRTLGEHLQSHNVTARFNELMMRLVVYNVAVIVEQAFEKGIYPSVKVPKQRAPAKTQTEQDSAVEREFTSVNTKESAESEGTP